MPASLYSLKAMERDWERYRSGPDLRRKLLPLTNRAERYLSIPRTQWLAMLPDRSPAPICDFPNPGSSAYFAGCPVTGAQLPQTFEPFDIIGAPFSVTLKSNSMVIYERTEDRPANSPNPVKGTITVPHWDNRDRTLEYCESDQVKNGKDPMRYYPANLVWRARLGAIIGSWSGGVLPDLAEAYRATGDNRFAELTLFILERFGKIIPNMPLAYYNGVDTKSREDLLKAAASHTPVGSHGWLGPARINGGAENFRPPMEGYYVFNLSKAYLSVEHAPAWGQTPEEAKARRDALKTTLFKELSLLFSSYGAKNCVGNGIGMYAPGLVGLGLVLQDRYFFDGFNTILEEFLYNENFYDGICTEGSLNYAGMVGGMYSLWNDLRSLYEPDYQINHPFITACGRSKQRLASLREIESQHGDGPNMAFMAKDIKQGADGKELREPSESFSGFGITMLRAGAAGKRLEVFLHHDRVTGHAHPDMLGLQVHFQGIPLISFIGDARMGRFIELQDDCNSSAKALRALPYPQPMEPTDDLQAHSKLLIKKGDNNPYSAWAYGINRSPFTKNTVVVDEYDHTGGRASWRGGFGDAKEPFGNLRLFKGSPDPDSESALLQVAEATGENMLSLHYQGLRTYRRSVIAITRPDGSPWLTSLPSPAATGTCSSGIPSARRPQAPWHPPGTPIPRSKHG